MPILPNHELCYKPNWNDIIFSNQQRYQQPLYNRLQCPLDQLNCQCDITRNQCDSRCCCDPDCSQTIIQYWQQQNNCLQVELYTTTCFSNYFLNTVNPKVGIKIKSSQTQNCIYNYDDEFNTGNPKYSIISQMTKPQMDSFQKTYTNTTTSIQYQTYYLSNQLSKAPFQIYGPDATGMCKQNTIIQNYQNVVDQKCYNKITQTATCDCTSFAKSSLMKSYYTTNIYVNNKKITVKNAYTINNIVSNESTYTQCTQSASICKYYTLLYIIYFVDYQGLITANTYSQVYSIGGGTSDAYVKQGFSLFFLNSDSLLMSLQNGYQQGLPVNIYQNSNNQISLINNFGFFIKGRTISGQCSMSSTETIYNPLQDKIMNFNSNMKINCYLTFTLAQLQTFCQNSQSLQSLDIYNQFNKDFYIGKTGSSVSTDSNSITYIQKYLNFDISWDSTNNICNFPTNLQFSVIYQNLQQSDNNYKSAIQQAQINYQLGTQMKYDSSVGGSQQFEITYSQNFYNYDDLQNNRQRMEQVLFNKVYLKTIQNI